MKFTVVKKIKQNVSTLFFFFLFFQKLERNRNNQTTNARAVMKVVLGNCAKMDTFGFLIPPSDA